MLTAPPGEDCNGIYYGGAGYSGGGGVRALTGDWGKDGGDGCCDGGGTGSGLKVSTISLQQITITPGKATTLRWRCAD